MRRLIIAALLLGLLLAPLEMLGFLRRGTEQVGELFQSSETQVLLSRMKIELPNLGEKVSSFFSELFPRFDLRVGELK